MSFWVNREHIGTELRFDDTQHRRGVVLSYAEGFSNHFPERGGEFEQPASV